MWDLSHEPKETREISQAASMGEGIAPSKERQETRSASISCADQNDLRQDNGGQICPSASSWSHPTPTHAVAHWPHCGHRLAIAVHSNALHDVDGRKVIIIQSKRSAASSRRPLQFDDNFDQNR
jgi:hypothetical protein